LSPSRLIQSLAFLSQLGVLPEVQERNKGVEPLLANSLLYQVFIVLVFEKEVLNSCIP